MKKILVTVFLIIIVTRIAFSQQVSFEEAERVARNFYYERINQYETISFSEIATLSNYHVRDNDQTVYYVFNFYPKGYVIVSGNKNVIPVPAYSLYSSCSGTDQPTQFTAWMKQYADQISYAGTCQIKPFQETISIWNRLLTLDASELLPLKNEKEVLPMLTSTWDQDIFYNQMCPADPAGPAGHCLTGCVATAMGQLCYYFRWPFTGIGSYSYEHPVYGTLSANFGDTEYKWNQMTNALQTQNEAVAELLFHLGVSVDMDYGPAGSGMWNHKAAYSLRNYFKYSSETQYLFRDSTSLDWDSIIVAHLDRKIPMYYAGWSVPNVNGHAFIVDGYQTEDYFHFNWGWGGAYDGYFYLDNLIPGGNNFNLAQELVINCYPDTINYTFPNYCAGSDTLGSLNGTIDDGSSPALNYENNANCSWLISPQTQEDSVSYITLKFNRFETEPDHDFVTIYDGATTSGTILGQYSGSNLPAILNSTGNKVLIVFQSDDAVNAAGWFLSYTSVIPTWCSGITHLTTPMGNLSDGSGIFNYHNGSACMWDIQPAGAAEATISFLDFDTEAGIDIVKIYDGASSQLLASYSGTFEPGYLPDPVTSQSGELFIIFSSNSTITRPGWSASYVSNGVGVDDPGEVNMIAKAYPNPVTDFLLIELNLQECQNVDLSIFDFHGRLILNKEFRHIPFGSAERTDFSGFNQGIYTVKLVAGNSIYFKKVVKIDW